MKLFLGLLIFISFSAYPETFGRLKAKQVSGIFNTTNYATNGDFEEFKYGWTASGSSTLTIASAAGTVARGKYSAQWDASASGETLTNTSVTLASSNNELTSAQCMFYFKYNAGDANLVAEMFDGTNNIGSYTLSTNTIFDGPIVQFFPCPSSGTLAFRLRATADAASITLDEVYWGLADPKMISISQATLWGSGVMVGAASCTYTVTAQGLDAFPADTDCNAFTSLVGNATTPSTKLFALTFASFPAGRYLVIANGMFVNGTVDCSFGFYDGVTEYFAGTGDSANEGAVGSISALINNTSDRTNVNISVYAGGRASSGTCTAQNNNVDQALTIQVYRFPTSSQTAMPFDAYNWFVAASISGAASGNGADLGGTDQATYVGITDTAFTMVNYGTLTAQIPCSTTVESSGLTCSSGSESFGVSFTPPGGFTGWVEACATFSHFSNAGASGSVSSVFTWVETGNADQTYSDSNGPKQQSGQTTPSTAGAFPHHLCRVFNLTATGKRTFRVFYEQNVTATVTNNTILTDAAADQGQRDIFITVRPLAGYNVPLLSGIPNTKVTSSNIVWAQLTNTGAACNVTYESGDWINGSGTRNGNGDCSWTVNTGVFSGTTVALGAPICTCTVYGTDVSGACTIDSTTVTTNLVIRTQTATETAGVETAADASLNLICVGIK